VHRYDLCPAVAVATEIMLVIEICSSPIPQTKKRGMKNNELSHIKNEESIRMRVEKSYKIMLDT